jgi:hypothetical protein
LKTFKTNGQVNIIDKAFTPATGVEKKLRALVSGPQAKIFSLLHKIKGVGAENKRGGRNKSKEHNVRAIAM